MALAACLGKDFVVEEKRLEETLEKAKHKALSSGVSMKSSIESDKDTILVEFAPFTLFPSVVPRESFQQIKSCMTDFNILTHRVAHDHEFLESALKNVIEADPFTSKLWDIYMAMRHIDSDQKQNISLGLLRNDFMLDMKDPTRANPKQIEINTIASSFAGLETSLVPLHRYSLDMIGKKDYLDQVPENDPALGLARGMVKAWELYGNNRAVIMFVVSENERNVFDQYALEFKVNSLCQDARVVRRTYLDIHTAGRLDSKNRLHVGGEEVAVIYLRSGYEPDAYPTQKEWDTRLMMEKSMAIKCPSIQYQLAGTKKIQQELARPGSLERFISDKAAVDRIRATFVQQHSVDLGAEGNKAVDLALAHPENYVLKPQREGGGNNLYGNDIQKFFEEHINSKERNAYILMERIFPPSQNNFLVKSGLPTFSVEVVSELGVYGVYIGSPEKEFMNTECGHMMRTKTIDTNEGGICAGYAFLDSPFFVSEAQFKQLQEQIKKS